MSHTEYYDLLGVNPNATEDEIKKAYRKMAVRIHPNPNDPQAAEAFQELQNAYSVLSDPNQRATYDRFGPEGLKRGGGGGDGPTMDDIFNTFFQFNSMPRSRKPKRGEDSVIPYDVTLEDLYNGKTAHFNLERNVICSHCEGSGGKAKAKQSKCIKCDGRGVVNSTQSIGGGRVATMKVGCPDCDGTGQKFKEKDRCKKCKGNCTTKEKKAVDLVIERGMCHNQKIILKGEGDQQPGVETGDVIFLLRLKPHDTIHRSPASSRPSSTTASAESSDLFTTVHLTLSEALLGFSRVVLRHLDGRGIHMSRQAESDSQKEGQGLPVKHGDLVVIRGDGMPVYDPARIKKRDAKGKGNDDDIEKGDLYITFEIEMPSAEWLASIDKKVRVCLPFQLSFGEGVFSFPWNARKGLSPFSSFYFLFILLSILLR
ncbi:DnaJ-domain-containing protein [Clavulina sp. PMI_390]|nr:DnaJ-domain-containing protein [Clavulina sp. PMI_390]